MNHSRHFLALPGDSLVLSAFPWYPTHTVSNTSPLLRMEKAQGIGGKSTPWTTHMPRWWDGTQRFYQFLTQREWDFWLSFSHLNFQKLNWLFFLYNPGMSSRPPKCISWTDDVLDCITAHSRWRAKCLEPPLCTTCKRVIVFDLYITVLE